jgi:primosomal protein N' (replication factor Y)
VARVAVDVPLAHLDRPFDYLVPAEVAEAATAGCRVRVRFAGQLVDGCLLERADASEHQGRLSYLERLVSPEPVLHAEIAGLAREVADRYAGTLADVLRLAVPPRHARGEQAARREAEPAPPPPDAPDAPPAPGAPGASPGDASSKDAPLKDAPAIDVPPKPGPTAAEPGRPGWHRYPAGPAFLAALRDGRAPRAVWSALPGEDWPARMAEAAAATCAGGRGAVLVVADGRDLDRVDAALAVAMAGVGRHVALAAALGGPASGAGGSSRPAAGEPPWCSA